MKNKNSLLRRFGKFFFVIIVPLLLILLFVYTGTSKLTDRTLFFHQLTKMPLIKPAAELISFAVPVMEIFVGILLLFGKTRTAGLIISSLMMFMFTLYVAFVLTGAHQPCSCGGVISKMSWTQHLYFNIAFFLLSTTSLFCYKFLHVYKGVSRKPSE